MYNIEIKKSSNKYHIIEADTETLIDREGRPKGYISGKYILIRTHPFCLDSKKIYDFHIFNIDNLLPMAAYNAVLRESVAEWFIKHFNLIKNYARDPKSRYPRNFLYKKGTRVAYNPDFNSFSLISNFKNGEIPDYITGIFKFGRHFNEICQLEEFVIPPPREIEEPSPQFSFLMRSTYEEFHKEGAFESEIFEKKNGERHIVGMLYYANSHIHIIYPRPSREHIYRHVDTPRTLYHSI